MASTYNIDGARKALRRDKRGGLKGKTYRLSLKGKGNQRQIGSYLFLEDRGKEVVVVRIDSGNGEIPKTLSADEVKFVCPISMPRETEFPGLQGARALLQALHS